MRDDEFDRMLRDSAPDARPGDEHRRRLSMQLDHNFRHHRRRRPLRLPSLTAAAFLAALALTIGWPVPIGSDVRDLVDSHSLGVGDMRVVKRPFRGGGISVRDSTPEAHREAEDLSDDMEARSYIIVGVAGWTAGGETTFDFLVKSTGLAAGRVVNVDIPSYSTVKDRVMARITAVYPELAPILIAEDWESVSTSVMSVENRSFLVTTKSMTLSGLGPVLLHEGELLE